MSLLMIGCGKMGGALLQGWLQAGLTDVTIADPGLDNAPEGADHVKATADLPDQHFDQIILAIKPQMVADVLPAYQTKLAPGGAFLSILAGTSLRRLTDLTKAPTVRAMPNLPALIGKGITALCTAEADPDHLARFEKLLEANGPVIQVPDEDSLDRFTAVAGSGPAYVFEFMRAFIAGAEAVGFDAATARLLVQHTLSGSVDLAGQSPEDLADLRRSVTSKAGTTEAGLAALMAGEGLDIKLQQTVKAAYKRARELAQ